MTREWIIQLLAQRVLRRLAGSRMILAHASDEFLLEEVADELRRTRKNADWHELSFPGDAVEDLEAALQRPEPIVITVRDGFDDGLRKRVVSLLERHSNIGGGPMAIGVVRLERAAGLGPETLLFDVEIGAGDLALWPADLVDNVPALAADRQRLFSLMTDTLGIPALVDAELDAKGSGARVADAWAKRLFEQGPPDPVTSVVAWLGSVPDNALSYLVSQTTGRPVSEDNVVEVSVDSDCIGHEFGRVQMPRLLQQAIHRQMATRDPERYDAERGTLIEAIGKAEHLSGMWRITALTELRAWEALDRLLATRLHLLLHLTDLARAEYATVWPARIPRSMPYLAHARALVDGVGLADVDDSVPRAWREFSYLVRSQDRRHESPTLRSIRTWLEPMARRTRPNDRAEAKQGLSTVESALRAEVHRLLAATDPSPDDVACLIGILCGEFDSAIEIGAVDAAFRMTRWMARLGTSLGPTVEQYSTLWPSALARAALVAARGGLQGRAQQTLTRMRQSHADLTDRRVAPFAHVAEHFSDLTPSGLRQHAELGSVDVDQPLAALHCEVHVLHTTLLKGPGAATVWARQTVNRARWTDRPAWEWWPVYAVLTLLEAQAGHVALARGWYKRTTFETALDLTLRASLEFAAGGYNEALELAMRAEQVGDEGNLSRIIATGVHLASLLALGDREGDVAVQLAAENWSDVLGAVSLFPLNARDLIVAELGAEAAAAPGLRPVQPAEDPGRGTDIRLTRRQLQILQSLAQGKTMNQIANELVVGVETVRSTAKLTYKRLGVHGRSEAVERAQNLGLIKPSL